MRSGWILWFPLLVGACQDITLVPTETDDDNDGFNVEVDCDDASKEVNPDAPELCDGVDNDCDEAIDEDIGDGVSFWADMDSDGYGAGPEQIACEAPTGMALQAGDCDDTRMDVNPGRTEICNERDDDCDGSIDNDPADGIPWYRDADADAWGTAADVVVACEAPVGRVANAGDCADLVPAVNPGALELCNGVDDDCDLGVDEDAIDAGTWYGDQDGDLWGDAATGVIACVPPAGGVSRPGDCADLVFAVNPGATELCNDRDDDCNGLIDDGATDPATWYPDGDGDGFGAAGGAVDACDRPAGYVAAGGDCDDAAPTVRPGGNELCNSVDDDCDGAVDDVAVPPVWYFDNDRDGYGSNASQIATCSPPSGYVINGGDCDDAAPLVNPGRAEQCNNFDDDCDTLVDEGAQPQTWYADVDADGYGDPMSASTTCTQPPRTVLNDDDCNDTNITINPGAREVCNGLDDDCDRVVDDGVGAGTWYADNDGDGFGDPAIPLVACTQPAASAGNDDDCDDRNALVRPGAPEQCNGLDDDCDTQIDEGLVVQSWYPDVDGDSWGDPALPVSACQQIDGTVGNGLDCDDGDAAIRPGAVEVCNYYDDDCDTQVDEGTTLATWFSDGDGDGYGNPLTPITSCTQPGGAVANDDDCADGNRAIFPGAPELCNRLDDDCDTVVDDGVVVPFWWTDGDQDGYGDPNNRFQACNQPAGAVGNDGDCDDRDPAIRPGAAETCDNVDEDCDSIADDGIFCDSGEAPCALVAGGRRLRSDFESAVAPGILQRNGTAVQTTFGGDGVLRLTDASVAMWQTSSAFFIEQLDGSAFCASFQAYIGGGTGADGLTFAWLPTAPATWVGAGGGFLGVGGTTGWAIELDTFQNNAGAPPATDPSENHLALVSTNAMADISVNTGIPELENTGWHEVEVEMDRGHIVVWLDGIVRIDTTLAGYNAPLVRFGFTGSTADFNNTQLIDDVLIVADQP